MVFLFVGQLLCGQWLNYPTAKVPKKPDGSADLSAPAPRTAEGKPDLSGIWQTERNRPCTSVGCDEPVGQEFVNIGWSIKGGLPYQAWALDLVKARRAQLAKDDPGSNCRPIGMVKIHTAPFLRKIVQTPDLLLILSERDTTFRQIFTDGRPLPADPEPSWNGNSTGHWEGDTLVVETNGLHDGTWLDAGGSPLTDAAKITERFRRVDYGHLEIELMVNDPKAYTKPWTVKMNHSIVLNTDLLEYYCTENERDSSHFVVK